MIKFPNHPKSTLILSFVLMLFFISPIAEALPLHQIGNTGTLRNVFDAIHAVHEHKHTKAVVKVDDAIRSSRYEWIDEYVTLKKLLERCKLAIASPKLSHDEKEVVLNSYLSGAYEILVRTRKTHNKAETELSKSILYLRLAKEMAHGSYTGSSIAAMSKAKFFMLNHLSDPGVAHAMRDVENAQQFSSNPNIPDYIKSEQMVEPLGHAVEILRTAKAIHHEEHGSNRSQRKDRFFR